MKEGFRLIRVEENPTQVGAAGYTVEYDDDVKSFVTDAPVDWSPDDLKTPEATPPQQLAENYFPPQSAIQTDIPNAIPPVIESQNTFNEPPPPVITEDDMFKEFDLPTEIDNELLNPDPNAPPKEEDPEGLSPDERNALGTGKPQVGKFTQAEFDETKIFVRIVHHGLQNGNAWLMQSLAGEGELKEYIDYDAKNFEVWTDLGAQLCAKYGLKPPLEMSYLAATGQNLGPAYKLAFQNFKLRKQNDKMKRELEEAKWKNYLMENADLIARARANGEDIPPPPENFPSSRIPPATAQTSVNFNEENGWVLYNDTWTHAKSKRTFPARDGNYIFNPKLGVMVEKVTGIVKTGRPKGIKDSKPRSSRIRHRADGSFMSKAEIEEAERKEAEVLNDEML